ncbi:MAG: hypothetical protein ACXIVO_09050 [Glycocaulis sp.]|uniref:hypothetical protein n=1 Tax=Glycocaulis sp. TaxID=1969725 RepID=UPI003F72AF39
MSMKTAVLTAAAALLFASLSHASIPPRYALLVVSADDEARAIGDALIQYMSAAGAFSRHPLTVQHGPLRACLAEADFAACARSLVPAREHWQEPAPVIVRVEAAGPGGGLAFSCVGSGTYRQPTADQQVDVDVQTALFGEGDARNVQLRAAMTCLQSAARESSAP